MRRRVRQSTPLVVHADIPALSLAAMYSSTRCSLMEGNCSGSEIGLERTASGERSAAALVQRVYDGTKAIGNALFQSVEGPSEIIRWPAGEDVEHRPGAIPFDPHTETMGLT